MLVVAFLLLSAVLPAANPAERSPMKIQSSAFSAAQSIPRQFTCEGADRSPALNWSDAPTAAKSFAVIADDPDAPAGTWVHWVIFNLPPAATSLPEGVPTSDSAAGGMQGRNDFGKIGYGGPCPPPGKPHRYFFKLYALDSTLPLKAGARKQDVERAMQGHILGQAELMGTYQRQR
jgi:Raf kinase inhibitor-like YbhB/YbcL family protein